MTNVFSEGVYWQKSPELIKSKAGVFAYTGFAKA
jgi:hypothetical protein